MKINFPLLLVALFLTLTDASIAEISHDWRVSGSGFGPVKLGMPLSELASNTNFSLKENGSLHESCSYYILSTKKGEISLRVVDKMVNRIEISEEDIKTLRGIGVGDEKSVLIRAYQDHFPLGHVPDRIFPHHYDREVYHYVVGPFRYHKLLSGVDFILTQGAITQMRIGHFGELLEDEGCS